MTVAYRVLLGQRAEKQIDRLASATQARIYSSLHALKEDPLQPRPRADIKALKGGILGYRLRIGDYRVFYSVVGQDVFITQVLHRSHAYD